ncbi:putative DUF51 family protein [Monocercomonoides exilis]|uniref:putative DUF51 family protein n=1 Tax=Monocercomonoides exilis TaxID=2049356 RepID=UPI00355A4A04|nr:putative DUF51 family protein [Monocercomonoides exilis]|eukprot:MONOS_2102.1-p1 / transcript=MONOS_2102.1 / gene=MONOS_2102 / organism=Monocercomonoides_exilis_PA203 / gene_product=AMME syndrome candidate gene 1 protein homolog / transcript_product=AMME syndrome candidate gene 1 protein homolog / location=Mono_scaffold00041:71313-72167(-) / protein_length=213 / sequence_SO=supercontig / SO=protein_coding / is_pseudo=false
MLIFLSLYFLNDIFAFSGSQDLCGYCFDTLVNSFDKRNSILSPSFKNEQHPIFVTWKKKGQLRGCIGTFSPLPLHSGLQEYALISAKRDDRFRPISVSEVPDLDVTVSIMHSFEQASRWDDWKVGVHGIRVSLNDGTSIYSATYLPEVMSELGWNQEQAIESCLQKGGYRGKLNDRIKAQVQVTRYQTSISKMDYQEYIQWRKAKLTSIRGDL